MSTKSISLLENAADKCELDRIEAIRSYESTQRYVAFLYQEMEKEIAKYRGQIKTYEAELTRYADNTVRAQADLADYQEALTALRASAWYSPSLDSEPQP